MSIETTQNNGSNTTYECDNVEDILTLFFNELTLNKYKYCVLHSYDMLPKSVGSDLDIAINIDNISNFESLLTKICSVGDWSIMQKLWYDIPACFYYVLRTNKQPFRFLAIDILVDPYGIGRYGFSTQSLIDSPVQHGIFYHSDPSIEFCYKLTKRIRKGVFKDEDKAILNDLYKKGDHDKIRRMLSDHFGKAGSAEIVSVFSSTHGFTGRLNNMLNLSIKQLLKKRYASLSIIIKRFIWQKKRVLYRITHPAGIIIILPERLFDQNKNIFTETVGPAFRYIVFKKVASKLEILKALSTSGLLITTQENSHNVSIIEHYSRVANVTLPSSDLSDEITPITRRIEQILHNRIATRTKSDL